MRWAREPDEREAISEEGEELRRDQMHLKQAANYALGVQLEAGSGSGRILTYGSSR